MQRGVTGLCQLTSRMLWSAKCCTAASNDSGSTLPWCCVLLSGSLFGVTDCCSRPGFGSGFVLGCDRTTTTTLSPSRAVLSSKAAWDHAEGLSKLRHWAPPEAAILSFLCWGCCIHLLTQVTSPKHPQGAQQFFRTVTAMESKGRKGKGLAFLGSLSSSSEACLATPMQMESVNKCPQGLFWGYHTCGRCSPDTGWILYCCWSRGQKSVCSECLTTCPFQQVPLGTGSGEAVVIHCCWVPHPIVESWLCTFQAQR